MADPKKFQIRIESILGGRSPSNFMSSSDNFTESLGVNPSDAGSSTKPSGILSPVASKDISNEILGNIPLWILTPHPKPNSTSYVYDYSGSVYTLANRANPAMTSIADGGSMSGSSGNGAAYYDNYVYFAKNTTIARYGPLDGTPAFNGDYWVTTLGKTALTNTLYPAEADNIVSYPNHVMHRHSDGKLYFADVVGNQGYLHVISTTKTTVEGDTDNGSTYLKLPFGYGLWPTTIESYGSQLIIGLYEGSATANTRGNRAKLAFWDTTSQNFNQITWVEFPDPLITAIKNLNGVLYVVSGQNKGGGGFRISKYIGGYSFEEVVTFDSGTPPFPGAVNGNSQKLYFGSTSYLKAFATIPSVYMYGNAIPNSRQGIFNVMGSTSSTYSIAYSIGLIDNFSVAIDNLVLGWSTGSSGVTNNGIDASAGNYTNDYALAPSIWQSKRYTIGQPFKITKIRIPLVSKLTSGMAFIPKFYLDDQSATTLTTVNYTNYPDKSSIVIRPINAVGNNDFVFEINWSGTNYCAINLPITIEYELLDD